MNAERLLAHYDRIADAPDAIPRLRRFILDLAVRGKLVPQNPNEEPASKLLDRAANCRTLPRACYGLHSTLRTGRTCFHMSIVKAMR
jgi:hypothetical protein